MRPFACGQCGATVYFENVHCGRCGAALGFVPALRRMLAFDAPAPAPAAWRVQADAGQPLSDSLAGQLLQPCANRPTHGVCNWMLDAGDPQPLCRSCRLTVAIPDLHDPINLSRWQRFEQAKRRLLFTLLSLGLLPDDGSDAQGTPQGLRFQLLASLPGQPAVLTGHDDGLITLNLAETDDVQREMARVQLGEPQRTLLGHLRHEVSHHLQQRHVDGSPAQDRCRAVFGDERADYAAALARHYADGPPADWPQRYISPYASAHPWEDWAETCAHYLLVVDALQTAAAWGLRLDGPAPAQPLPGDDPSLMATEDLVLNQWLPVSRFLTAMARSLGQPDPYPYQIPDTVLDKMALVQDVLRAAAQGPPGSPDLSRPAATP